MKFRPAILILIFAAARVPLAHAWGDHPTDSVPPTEGEPPARGPEEESEETPEPSTLPRWNVVGISLSSAVVSDKSSDETKAATAIVGGPGAKLEAVAPGGLPNTELRGLLDSRLLLLGRGEARGGAHSFSGGSITLEGESSWLPPITGNRHEGLRLRLGAGGSAHLGGITAIESEENRDPQGQPVLDPRADARVYGSFGVAYHDGKTMGELGGILGVTGELAGPELLIHKGLRARLIIDQDLLAGFEALDHRFWLGPQETEHRLRELTGSVYRRASNNMWLGADARVSDRERAAPGSAPFSRTAITISAGAAVAF